MGPDPRMVSFVVKSALVACLVVTVLCLLLTTGTAPAAGSVEMGLGHGALPATSTTALPTQAETCPLSTSYPQRVRQWCDLIVISADQHNFPPGLIAALILQESGGDPLAYSPSGAVGLMQVMPRDGLASRFQCPNGPCFASRPTIAELQDPDFNIEYATRLLAGLLARSGDLRLALKSYGPLNVGYAYADAVLAIYENYH